MIVNFFMNHRLGGYIDFEMTWRTEINLDKDIGFLLYPGSTRIFRPFSLFLSLS